MTNDEIPNDEGSPKTEIRMSNEMTVEDGFQSQLRGLRHSFVSIANYAIGDLVSSFVMTASSFFRHWVIRHSSFLFLWLSLGACLSAAPPMGNPGDSQSHESFSYRRIYAPADRIEQWPRGDTRYLPVETKRFEQLVAVARQMASGAPSDRLPRLTRATYTARLAGDVLVDGTAELLVDHARGHPSTLSLEPCSLAVAETFWDEDSDRPAVMGRIDSSGLGVVVERSGTLRFAWTLRGRRDTADDLSFHFELPSSTTKQLRLELPAGVIPIIEHGHVRRLDQGDGDAQVWQIELGRHDSVDIRISAEVALQERRRLTLVRQQLTYDMLPRGLDVSAQFTLDVHHEPLRRLAVLVDQDVRIVAARIGDEPVPWSLFRDETTGKTRVVFDFDEPIHGTGRVLRISGVVPLVMNREMRLPQIHPEGLFWESGSARLLIAEPLVLARLDLDGCRQTASEPLRAPRSGHSIELEYFSPTAAVDVMVSRRDARLKIRAGTSLLVGAHEVVGRTVCDCTVAESNRFDLSAIAHPDWIIESVESVPAAALSNWEADPTDEGEERLSFQLDRGLSPLHPVRLIVTGRLRRSALEQPLSIADLRMLTFAHRGPDRFLTLIHTADPFQIKVNGDTQGILKDPNNLDAESAELVDHLERGLLFETYRTDPSLTISLAQKSPRYAGEVHIDANVMDASIEESYRFVCTPEDRRIDRVRVHFAQMSETPLNWTMTGEDKQELTARKLDVDVQLTAGDSQKGESWEVSLRRPRSTPFEFQAVRIEPLASPRPISLAWLPEATEQRGRVTIRSTTEDDVVIENHDLIPTLSPSSTPSEYSSVRGVFQYDPLQNVNPTSEPILSVSRVGRKERPGLAWVWHAALDSRCAPDGTTAHAVLYRIQNAGRHVCQWTLPVGATLRTVWIDQELVPHDLLRVSGQNLQIELPRGSKFPEVTIHMTTASPSLGVFAVRQPPWPKADLPVLTSQWTVWLPPGYEVTDGPRIQPLMQTSWRHRLFGPFARDATSQPFDPLDTDHWLGILNRGASRRTAQHAADLFLQRLGSAATRQQPGYLTTWGDVLRSSTTARRSPTGRQDLDLPIPMLIDRRALLGQHITSTTPFTPTQRGPGWGQGNTQYAADVLRQSNLALVAHPKALVLTAARVAATFPSPLAATREGASYRIAVENSIPGLEDRRPYGAPISFVPVDQWTKDVGNPAPPWNRTLPNSIDAASWSATELASSPDTTMQVRIVHRSSVHALAMTIFLVASAVAFWQFNCRPWIWSTILSVSAVAALILPAQYAVLATGAVLGALASLLVHSLIGQRHLGGG